MSVPMSPYRQKVETYVDQGATHSESSWGPRLHIPIEFLYPPSTV